MSAVPTVHVVDDDASTRELLAWLMQRHGIAVATFPDARSFLRGCKRDAPGCIILDLDMPGMSGLDVQQDLKAQGVTMPVIFLSGRADVPKAVRAVREGERVIGVGTHERRAVQRADGRWGGHVFNLGHGISQHTPAEHVQALVEAVHGHSQRRSIASP